jgi:N-acetyl-gamma-glutamyl-phosphate reductase
MGGMGLKVGVYGGSGYAGIELVRLLAGHPEVGAMSVASRGYAGLEIGDVYPQLAVDGAYVAPEEIEASDLDVAWYGEHPAPELLAEAHYGLPEVFGATAGRLVANPGCYPTAAILALAPVVKRMGAGICSVTINALSGVSGAGAKPSVKTHFVSVNESAGPYGAPRHRHTPEIETILRRVGQVPEITFVPHLIPITRGELETIVVDVGEVPEVEEVLGWYAEDYEGWAFVEAREEYPHVSHVANTNRCRLSAAVDSRAGKLLLFSAVDNLLKGASGAAVQNMNLALGYEEYYGLEHLM